MPSSTDWRREKLSALLEAASHAISRARYVFVISNVAGILILASLFNSAFPWIRHTIDHARRMTPIPPHLPHLEKTLFQDLWTLNVPLLGLKVSTSDISILGPTALLVIAIWQYFCVSRENVVVRSVRNEWEKCKSDKECAAYLYHGVAHHFVFTTRFSILPSKEASARVGAAAVVSVLFFMPAWVPLLIVASDLWSVFVPYLSSLDPSKPIAQRLTTWEAVEIAIRDLYAFILAMVSLYYCVQCRVLDRATREAVEEMTPPAEAV